MDIHYFTLTEGVLELHVDKLVIFDNAKRNRFSNMILSISQFLYSVICISRGIRDNDSSWLYFGIALAIFWIFFFILRRNEFQRIDNEIYLKDISEVSFKDDTEDTEVATIMTRKNRRRKVIIEKTDSLPNRFKSNLKDLNIKVSDV